MFQVLNYHPDIDTSGSVGIGLRAAAARRKRVWGAGTAG